MRRFSLALLLVAASAGAADALVLSCFPDGPKEQRKFEAYVDGFVPDEYPPQKIEAVRVLGRMGEDVFEYFPEHTKLAEFRDGVLRLHLLQLLSAGETAEIRFEGKVGTTKGEPFKMTMFMRSERRTAEGGVRCTID